MSGEVVMKIRKLITQIEEVRSERGIEADVPLRKVAVVAIFPNPFAGQAFQEDLSSLTDASEAIAREISHAAIEAMKPLAPVSYGKGGVVGLSGEQEHVNAMVTTVFGNVLRDAADGGSAWISSFTKRAAPGTIIEVPLAHKDALYVRSHYDGMSIHIPDGPLPDEIALICVYANRGRLNARVGGLGAEDIVGQDGLI